MAIERDFKLQDLGPKLQKDSVRSLKLAVAALLGALTMVIFLNNAGLVPGGFVGLSVLVQKIGETYFHVSVPFSVLNIAFNVIPAAIAFFLVGRKFVIFSLLSMALFSFLVDVIPDMPITTDPLLNVVFGSVLNGISLSVALNADACLGGTDFVGMIFSSKLNISVWNYVWVFNAVVLLIFGFLFGWDAALYSVIYQALSTLLLNKFHARYQKKTIFLITTDPEPISTDLMRLTKHGITSFEGIGRYSGKKRTLLYMVASKEDVRTIRKYIKEHDHDVFMNISESGELDGRFFLPPID